ncbi:SMI1/KNR4 family protein [Puia dinghuensis]|uniref:Knr4/Smi1-like domain-containing protein n=1 Tax=Puia dinghuensis TaxID=1792502 RepID=A0A8J2UHT7_9BACT|nr:SMI1/KNR4 family protein [Puia dinghuensis]GGB19456.1 hypothetical protein GCM10011511_48980 [Puia dinghuensis]
MPTTSQPYELIRQYLDTYFEALRQEGPYALAHPADLIPRSMIDLAHPLEGDEEYACWKPIPGTFNDKDLKALESLYGHPLPVSYLYFLQQLHFIELYMDQNSLAFFPSFPRQLASGFRDILKKYYPELPARGFLPFANYGDWGVACFDARQPAPANDYPVVVLDHEDGYTNPMPYTASFLEMFERARDGFIWLGVPGWQPDPNRHHHHEH